MKQFNSLEINNYVTGIDLFICSSGFEYRCLNLIKNLDMKNVKHTIIYYINDFYKENIENASEMEKLTKSSHELIEIKYKEPEVTFKIMRDTIQNKFQSSTLRNILVDITTFTHEHLLMLFRIINQYKSVETKVFYCYTTARCYSRENNEKIWLTKGSGEIHSVIGYPGYSDLSKKNHLIIIMGFEIERTKKIIENFDYEKITLCIGGCDESISNSLYCVNKEMCREIIESYPQIDIIEISLIDANKTKSQLLDYIENFYDFNNTIIPMNNKISTIGVAMLALEKHDLRLCYIPADEYNKDNYSQVGDIIIYLDEGM